MGGLRRELPAVFWTFSIGCASLSAVPLVTSGFYSKDLILWQAWSSTAGGPWLFAAGLIGAFITSVYTFRMLFLTFCGEPQPLVKQFSPLPRAGAALAGPLIILAAASVVGGLVELPATLGNRPLFSDFLGSALPAVRAARGGPATELALQIIVAAVSLAGIGLAYTLFLRQRAYTESLVQSAFFLLLHRFWLAGWGFDWLYDRLFVRPIVWFARIDKDDFIDSLYQGIAWLSERCHRLLSRTQTGRVRWYAMGISAGAVIVIAIVVWL
jgi:NADH-quinone oxidoreductase subunit L